MEELIEFYSQHGYTFEDRGWDIISEYWFTHESLEGRWFYLGESFDEDDLLGTQDREYKKLYLKRAEAHYRPKYEALLAEELLVIANNYDKGITEVFI